MIWILEVFYTLLSIGIEAITGIIFIQSHIQKLSGKNQLQTSTLPINHTLKIHYWKNDSLLNHSNTASR